MLNLQIVLCLHDVPRIPPRIGHHLLARPTFAGGDIPGNGEVCNIYTFTSIVDINTARPHYRVGKLLFTAVCRRECRETGMSFPTNFPRDLHAHLCTGNSSYATKYVTIGKRYRYSLSLSLS